MDDHDEDFFSDDDFDDLPPATLLQLEQNAYRSTQFLQQGSQTPSARQEEPPRNDAPGNIEQPDPANLSLKPPRLHTGLTNEYGSLDVGELDAEVLDDGTGSTSALDQAMAFAGQQAPLQNAHLQQQEQQQNYAPMVDENQQFYHPPADGMMEDIEGEELFYPAMNEAHDALAEKLMLEGERNRQVMEELAAAKSLAATKAGEIAIIRANQAKLADNYDRQLAAMRKSIEEETAKHRQDLEAIRAEGKMLATENAFLRQDLTEEMMRTNNLKAKSKAAEKEPPVTPKKPKSLPFRDGFDDEEIVAISPSKSAAKRSKQQHTPVIPGKRKRQLSQDSPTKLQIAPRVEDSMVERPPGALVDDVMLLDMNMDEEPDVVLPPPPPPPAKEDPNLQFVKLILDHRAYPNQERDLEMMTTLSFPSEPQRKMSTMVLEETAKLQSENYVVGYSRIIASLWSRALKERFFNPIPMFMAIIRFLLELDMSSIPGMIEHLVPVLQDTGDVNGVVRFKHSPVWRQNLGQARQTPRSELHQDVDSTEAVSLLYRMACGCLHLDRAMESFWQHIRYDFILMMLNCSQPIQDIILTLNFVVISIRGGPFGSIQETEGNQIATENYLVDRVANLMSEIPQVDEGQDPYTRIEICSMRLEALSLLMAITFQPTAPTNEHGSSVVASHPTALARLIRAMHDELDALYTYPPERDLHAALVNGLMRLVYGILRRHEDVDLQSKLGQVAGGKQKFLVVLTRLAFSEGPILEEGIEDETVEMAHEILDDAVNPQEAEALLEAFPSAKHD